MDASDVETASDVSDRVLRDLELLAQRLDHARVSADPRVWRTLREDLRRITQEIVTKSVARRRARAAKRPKLTVSRAARRSLRDSPPRALVPRVPQSRTAAM